MPRAAFLSQHEFDALLAWLAPCRDLAGEKYEAIRRALLKYFAFQQCDAADEHVDETIDRVARRVAAGEIIRSAPYHYFRGVARKISLECVKRRARLFDLHLLTRDALQPSDERARDLDECLRSLPPHTRELLEGYYLGNRAVLAASLGITPNALRLRVFKEKRRLRARMAEASGDEQVSVAHVEITRAKSPLRGEASRRAGERRESWREEVAYAFQDACIDPGCGGGRPHCDA
jgi:DNA-directed RNA polymerase specialized sigma24 family protein